MSDTTTPSQDTTPTTLALRLQVQGIALQELMRALDPTLASQIADSLLARLQPFLDAQGHLNQDADDALAGDVSAMLAALRRTD